MADFYNRLLESVILPSGDLLLGTNFISELRKWRKISRLKEAELRELSIINLRKLLAYATANVPYYRTYSQNGKSDPVAWLKEFPVVDKSDYNNNIDSFLSSPKDNLIPQYSSGSSGVQGVVYMNKKEQSSTQAIQTLLWEWSGYYPGKPIVQTGITPDRGFAKSLKDCFFKTRYYNAFGLDNMQLSAILQKQTGLSKYHLGGYASSLFLLAQTANEHAISDIKFDVVISWGDKMFDHYRKEIEKAFGCKVYDTYGSTEGTVIAGQCDLEYYYILTPHVWIELLDENHNEVEDGKIGHVVVTRLDSYSMPLIRYKLGDLAIRLPRHKYPERRELAFPLLEKIIGRNTDIIKTASGKFMIVHFFTGIFEHVNEIKQFKVVQRDLNSIEIEYIPGEGFSEIVLGRVSEKIKSYLNEEFPIKWKQVDFITPTKSGKPQIIQSLINNNSLSHHA
jgi:phenylacetate-CoA ligase